MGAFFGALLGVLGLGGAYLAIRPRARVTPEKAAGHVTPPGYVRICGIVPGPNSCFDMPATPPELDPNSPQFWYDRGFNGETLGTAPSSTDIYFSLGSKEKAAGQTRRDLAKAPITDQDWRAAGLEPPAPAAPRALPPRTDPGNTIPVFPGQAYDPGIGTGFPK